MVGGAAAALAGLVFVSLSLNLDVVMRDATHRFRAVGTLTNFVGVFVVYALALMGGQNHAAVGAEWLFAATGAGAVYVYGYLRARTAGGSQTTLSLLRTVSGTVLYLAQIVGVHPGSARRDGWAVHRWYRDGGVDRLLGFRSLVAARRRAP
jgi:hypothetical protein